MGPGAIDEVADAEGRLAATWLIKGMLARLSQPGHSADSSLSPIRRSTSNVLWQSLQRYSYTGMEPAYHSVAAPTPDASRAAEVARRTCVRYTVHMVATPMELLLPLGETVARDELPARRWHHLMTVSGVDARSAQRLARAFPSLAAVYRADEEQLVRVVGPVVASRIRWFLDAPLDTGISPGVMADTKAA